MGRGQGAADAEAGVWRDPETRDFWQMHGYCEECVWANYVKENRWMFQGRDVEGRVDDAVCEKEDILVQPGVDQGVEQTFAWAVDTLLS